MSTSLTAVMAAASSEDQLLAAAAAHLQTALESDACDILTATVGGGLLFRASTSSPEMAGRIRLAAGVGLAGEAFQTGRAVTVESDLQTHRAYRSVLGVHEEGFASALVVPMLGPDGSIGVVFWQRMAPWEMTADTVERAERLAAELASGLLVFRSAYEAGAQTSRMSVLSEATRSLSESLYLEEILQLLVNLTATRFNYRVVTVRLLDAKSQELILRATQATHKAYQRKRAIKLGESIAGRAIRESRTVIVDDVQTSHEYIGHDLAEEQGLRAMICVPLMVQGRAVGVMTCYTGEVREFSEDEISALETLAKQAAVSIEHAKLQVRNTLMQEMHHRVKNNLQQVASLLRLQLRQSHYEKIEDAINDSLGRILAIAAVHELLSRDDLDHVSIKSIAESLGMHQQQSFIMPGKRITFSIRGDEVFLNTNQATQVALILNELIQNAVEHGFRIKTAGEIHVTIEDRDDVIGIWVSNDGDPLPADFDVRQGHLGLQIIRSLVGALGGTFEIADRLGWTVGQVVFSRQTPE